MMDKSSGTICSDKLFARFLFWFSGKFVNLSLSWRCHHQVNQQEKLQLSSVAHDSRRAIQVFIAIDNLTKEIILIVIL